MKGAANSITNLSIFCRSVMSKFTALALSFPCLRTKSSSLSSLRPTAMTLEPSWIRRSAIAAPIPDVAPTRRICLYWKGIVGFGCLGFQWVEGIGGMLRWMVNVGSLVMWERAIYTRFLWSLFGFRMQDLSHFEAILFPLGNILHTALSMV